MNTLAKMLAECTKYSMVRGGQKLSNMVAVKIVKKSKMAKSFVALKSREPESPSVSTSSRTRSTSFKRFMHPLLCTCATKCTSNVH